MVIPFFQSSDTIEGDLTPEEIKANHTAQPEDLPKHQFLDDPYYASRDYDLADIEGGRHVPKDEATLHTDVLLLTRISALLVGRQLGWHHAASPWQRCWLHRGWI